MRRAAIALFIAALAMTAPAAAAAPRMGIASIDELRQPVPIPYDEAANASSVVAAAQRRARRTGKLLIIDLGGNWCLDCRILAGTMATEPLRSWLAHRFEIVTIDIGRLDRNLAIPRKFGVTGRLEGVPALLVVEPVRSKLLNPGKITALADARAMTPQGLADWFGQWRR